MHGEADSKDSNRGAHLSVIAQLLPRPEVRALVPQLHGEVYDHAMAKLLEVLGYNWLTIRAIVLLAALCLFPHMGLITARVVAAIVVYMCVASVADRLVCVRRASKLMAVELARLGY